MNKESQYLLQIIAHETWHIEQQGEAPEDLSCITCFPVDTQQVSNEFAEFWKYFLNPRCPESKFNANSLQIFEQLRQLSKNQQVSGLILQLVQSI
jgi:hypothetical protein